MQSYECVIISKMFLIYFISYGCNDSALVFLGGAEASASPSFALPMFITIKKIIILHLFLGVPAATVGGTGTPWHTCGYAPDFNYSYRFPTCRLRLLHSKNDHSATATAEKVWNYICVNKNESNFIQTNVTFPETIKNMPLQKKKNTMKT